MEDVQKSGEELRIVLLGPMAVLDSSGVEVTPRNQKSKAALAMLALSPRGSRSRVWLRDKLWSDRGPDQSSASLRQALRDIRKSLGSTHRELLLADRYSVTLDLSQIEVDVVELLEQFKREPSSATLNPVRISEHFLEGFDIYDPEFEAWLTLERRIWEQRFTEAASEDNKFGSIELQDFRFDAVKKTDLDSAEVQHPEPPKSTYLGGEGKQGNWAIGLQGPGLLSPDASGNASSSILADKLVRSFLDMGRIKTIRLAEGPLPTSKIQDPTVPEIPLVIRILEATQLSGTRLSVEVLSGSNGVTLWSASQSFNYKEISDPAYAILNGLTARTVIEIGRNLMLASNPHMVASGHLIECINKIFGLSTSDLAGAERTLATLLKHNPNAQTYAWMAFAKSFQVGQRFTTDAATQISEAHYYATRALEEDAHDPLVLSLAAHIHSYLFCEYDVAASLFERALKADREQTIAWDLYAMLNAYTGHGKKSIAMADWAQHLGSNTPFSYYFDTTKCIASALAGDHSESIKAGERALAQRPKFNSILRYLISSHAHLGNVQMVESLRKKLGDVEPDFSVDVLLGAGYPGLGTEGGRQFLQGLKKAGYG